MKAPKKLLATGHCGFVGTALRRFCLSQGESQVQWCAPPAECDLLDAPGLLAMVQTHRPDWVVHLAAQSEVPLSWKDPERTMRVNVCGTVNLLKALTDSGFRGRLLYVSSADVYGPVPEDALPVSEETPIRPANPYASSKVAAEVVCRQWARTRELDVVIARPFNHTGAGQRPDFVLAGLARQLAAVRLGRQPARVLAGDLDLTRDFLDVRDVLKAYLALLAHGEAGETYNVCSGREVHLGQTLGRLIELAGVEVEIATDAALLRPAQQRRMRGSHHKITVATGWTPAIALDETLQELLAHWTRELDT